MKTCPSCDKDCSIVYKCPDCDHMFCYNCKLDSVGALLIEGLTVGMDGPFCPKCQTKGQVCSVEDDDD